MTYMTTSTATKLKIRPATEAQSPDWYVSSTMAMMFCMKIEGAALTMALMRMHTSVTGSSTG